MSGPGPVDGSKINGFRVVARCCLNEVGLRRRRSGAQRQRAFPAVGPPGRPALPRGRERPATAVQGR
ncbi:hypothetical protein GCM10009605_25030 [Nocardiopsis composta]